MDIVFVNINVQIITLLLIYGSPPSKIPNKMKFGSTTILNGVVKRESIY